MGPEARRATAMHLVLTGIIIHCCFVARQAAFLVSDSFSRDNCNGRMPTFMCSNTVIASFNDRDRFAFAAANQANAPYNDDRIWARGPNANDFHIGARGFVVNSEPKVGLVIEGLIGATGAGTR